MTKLNKKTITKTFFSMFILTILMTCTPVYATEAANVVTAKFTAFQNLLGGIISSIGSIITLWEYQSGVLHFKDRKEQCRQMHLSESAEDL